MQRLLAEAISSQEQRAVPGIIYGKGEHAAQSLYAIATEFFVEVDNGFGIRVGAKDVAAGAKFVAQLNEVINFPVVDDPDSFIFIGDGLVPGREVDNAKSAHAQPDRAIDVI